MPNNPLPSEPNPNYTTEPFREVRWTPEKGVHVNTVPLGKHLGVGRTPKNDEEWREAIAFIQLNLKGIMAICNRQAGPNAYGEYMPYEENVLFWYGHLANMVIKHKNAIAEPELAAIEV